MYGDKVVAIGSENLYRALAVKGENSVRVYSLVPKTYIIILELVGSNCQVLDIRVIDGDYVDSRLYNGTLYLVTSLGIATSGLKPYIPRVNGVEVSYDKILVASNEYPDTYSIIYALNLDTMEDNETVFVHNHASRIYMSYTSIYLIGYVIDYSWLFNRLADIIDNESVKEVIRDIMESSKPLIEKIAMVYDIIEDYLREKGYTVRVWINDKLETIKVNDTVEIAILPYTPWRVSWNTSIHRFIYQGLYIEYIGSDSLPGRILDPYSIDEYNGTLRIALHNDDSDDNSLYVLDIDSMEVVGYVTGIGEGMDIYAARYIGDKAYLVTYRRTDPLYVIDLSDPENPVVLGKLVMPGYSDYLHPLTNTLLLGIGVDDNGYIKVQVYNVSNPLQPVIVSSLTLGSGYTSVLHEYKAFTINTRDKYFIIPYNGYTRFKNNGFYVIAYSLNGSLTVKGFIGIDRPTRSVFIEDIVYCIGSSSVVSVNATTMEILDTIEID